ncbi:MAG: glycosyltransferase family 2 protein [Bacillus sp. (in: Bacteria)]|nr:glycosyltransferase family 2 protein [Bacillus sp. (in: firmicutes)]MCM1426737.1 glycosyltransferase family 2 protein [Eubacterium sp.]
MRDTKLALTFIIPAYNAEKTLVRTLESILWQTDDRYCIIIVDDGSMDRTAEIGHSYAGQYPEKIRYIYQKNKKQCGGARNTGLRMTETAYVSFLDSDDWLMPDYVEQILGEIEKALQPPEMIMTLPVIYHEQSHIVRDWYDKKLFEQVFSRSGVIVEPQREKRLYQFEVNACRKVLSMEFVRRTKFAFREEIKWEDVYPHFYLLSECHSCMGVYVGFYYRIGESTQTTAATGRERLDILPVFEDLLHFMKRQDRDELVFPIMRIILRFSFWCIRMADVDTRKTLVYKIQRFFRRIPKKYIRILARESIKQYALKDALQYMLLSMALRSRIGSIVFYDYLFQEVCEKIIKKALKAENKVA